MTKRRPNFFALIGGLLGIATGISYALSGSTPVWGLVAITAGITLVITGLLPLITRRNKPEPHA